MKVRKVGISRIKSVAHDGDSEFSEIDIGSENRVDRSESLSDFVDEKQGEHGTKTQIPETRSMLSKAAGLVGRRNASPSENESVSED